MITTDYTEGQVAEVTVTFRRSSDDTPITPTALTVRVRKPDGMLDGPYVLGTDNELVTTSTGVITLLYDLTDAVDGHYRVEFRATDSTDGVRTRVRRRFRVLPSHPFPTS